MIKLAVLNNLNLLDSIQVRVNERGEVSQEQRSILEEQPSFLSGIFERLWSNISHLGIYLIGMVLLVGFGATSLIMWGFSLFMFAAAIGIAVITELPVHNKRTQIQNDIAANQIKKGIGTIVFEGEALMADIGERHLILPRNRNGLLPGFHYRFFYLDSSGIVLSVEEIESLGENIEKEKYQEILYKANQFNPQAMASNRNGRLIPAQQIKLFAADLINGGLIILGFTGIALYFLNIYTAGMASGDGGGTLSLICGSVSILIGLVGVLSFGRAVIDLLRGKVLTVSGIGRKAARVARQKTILGKNQEKNPIAYYYEIGEILFKVKEPAADAFVNDIRYKAYYTPLSKTLVGIEPIESPARAAPSD